MKKLIVQTHLVMKAKELQELSKDLNEQWNRGVVVLPKGFSGKVIEDEWRDAEIILPAEGQTVLIWHEYTDEGRICQTYGFGWVENGRWVVCLQSSNKVLAWMPLPEPYEVYEGGTEEDVD